MSAINLVTSIQLRDYQIDIACRAAEIITQHGFVLLLMQMRTGKTLTSLYTAQLLNKKNVLFATKKKVIENIYSDYEGLGCEYKLTVTNYEQLGKLSKEYDLVIVDEHHSFSAYPKPSKRTTDLKKLCDGVHTIMLSGTPTPESYSQLYHPLWCVNFWPHKNFYAWAKEYVKVKLKYVYNRQINDYSNANFERIEREINHLCLHYTKDQAGFQSDVHDEIQIVPMPDDVRKAIAILNRDKIIQTKSGETVLADTAVKLMSKIHQICSGTVKSESGSIICFNDFKAKYIFEKFKGKKIAIFYKYIGERELLKRYFNNIAYTDKEFNENIDKVYLSQIQSGREGINLSSADFIVMFNIDYSALSYLQVRERMEAKERVSPSKIIWIFVEGGIEGRIYNIVKKKEDFTLSHFKKKSER
jgi:hypothetical protein